MKVKLAKHAGFCMGVRRAVDTTLDVIQTTNGSVATLGPLIHNPQVLELLHDRGVTVLHDIPESADGTVVIRAHGVPPEKKQELFQSGARVLDATCPRVVKVQVVIAKHRQEGRRVIIIGDKNHAEVDGLMGYAGDQGVVVSSMAEARSLTIDGPFIIVSQTTQDEEQFDQISRDLVARFPDGKIFNTICNSTHKRQEEVRRLCKDVEAMVVVGGAASANTQRLGEIIRHMDRPVYVVETEADLDPEQMRRYEVVGVTAGASTPTWLINRVVRRLESIPGRDQGHFSALLWKTVWLFLTTNITVGLAGASMTVMSLMLLEIPLSFQYPLVSFCYIFAMHNFNRFADQRSKKFNDPVRALFYQRFRWPLLVVSACSLAVALAISFQLGEKVFWLLGGMSVLGIFYSEQLFPRSFRKIFHIRGMREIPCSKSILVGIAWAFLIVVLPVWATERYQDKFFWPVFFWVLCLIYVRHWLFDLFDIQGDRMVGKETLPVCVGEKKTFFLLKTFLAITALEMAIFPFLGLVPYAGWIFLVTVAALAVLTMAFEKQAINQGPRLELMVESVFFLSALLVLFLEFI